MTFYITKYALTEGIIEVDSAAVKDLKVEEGCLRYFDKCTIISYRPGEWYSDRSQAVADAQFRRKKKIISLKKQIEKLENLKIE